MSITVETPTWPDAGDIVWTDFGEPVGHEQGGRRPALVLTPASYNRNSSVALVCPISRSARPWPFKVALPPDFAIAGFVLVDQLRVVDPVERFGHLEARAPDELFAEVLGRLAALLGIMPGGAGAVRMT